MDQVALRLDGSGDWVHLGGRTDAKKPLEVVLRAFDAPVTFASGDRAEAPADAGIEVPPGEGRRLAGRHFFVRSLTPCRLTYRGI